MIAEDNAGIVGYGRMKPEGDAAWLYFLGVRATAPGRGLGQVLAVDGLARVATRGAVCVQLSVDAAGAPPIRTYRSLGFTTDHVDHACALDVAARPPSPPARA